MNGEGRARVVVGDRGFGCDGRDMMRHVLPFLVSAIALFFTGCSRDQSGPPIEESVVVFRAADGRTLTMADLRGETGTFRYEILDKSNVPKEAASLHKQARLAGGKGDYKQAINLFEQASRLAPSWPYPVYDMAYTYLLMKDSEKARTHYRKTVELSVGTYRAYLALESMEDDETRSNAVRQLVKRAPSFAPAWKELAVQSKTEAEKLAAIEKGLAARPDAETKGILLINKALIMDQRGDHDVAVRSLGDLALDPASTYGTEHLAKASLAYVARNK
jgi:tetratricopeptide (TPR) repeat protein